MYRYKIMVIDDEISSRIKILEPFLGGKIMDNYQSFDSSQQGFIKEKIRWEFDICYPREDDVLEDYISSCKADAYFMDVFLSKQDKAEEWSIEKAFSAVRQHNPNAPIFLYSVNWADKGVLERVASARASSFPEKVISYYFDYRYIGKLVESVQQKYNDLTEWRKSVVDLYRERCFIKDRISENYHHTIKEPYSAQGDVVLLHISDLQYGDKNYTKNRIDLYNCIINACNDLKDKGEISGIDLVVMTGDISMSGKDAEFNQAKRELKDYLFKNLWKEDASGRVLVVPGNHDYDLRYSLMKYVEIEFEEDGRTLKFEKTIKSLKDRKAVENNTWEEAGYNAYKRFASSINGYNSTNNQTQEIDFIMEAYTAWRLRFVCLNSNNRISENKTNGVAFNAQSLQDIENMGGLKTGIFTIVLTHHSPLWEESLEKEERTGFHRDVVSILRSMNVNLWLSGHGHTHRSKIQKVPHQEYLISEASTLCLDEEDWDETYEVQTEDGNTIHSRRGFDLIILRKDVEQIYNPTIISFVFDKDGFCHRVKEDCQ